MIYYNVTTDELTLWAYIVETDVYHVDGNETSFWADISPEVLNLILIGTI